MGSCCWLTQLVLQATAASNAKASCLTNLALISQREGNLTECFSWCEKALRWDAYASMACKYKHLPFCMSF